MRVPFSPHPLQHMLLPVLLIVASIIVVMWYSIVVLICISLLVAEVKHLFILYICWAFVCLGVYLGLFGVELYELFIYFRYELLVGAVVWKYYLPVG